MPRHTPVRRARLVEQERAHDASVRANDRSKQRAEIRSIDEVASFWNSCKKLSHAGLRCSSIENLTISGNGPGADCVGDDGEAALLYFGGDARHEVHDSEHVLPRAPVHRDTRCRDRGDRSSLSAPYSATE